MFTRASSVSNNKHDALNKLRSSDRKSPSMNRKSSGTIPEESSHDNDSLYLSKNLSTSRTSLDSLSYYNLDDDVDAPCAAEDDQYDSDLDANDEPETWSELVDKKVQRKMHAKDIKRQDVIYELIQTEAQYVRVLHVMRKIYARTMIQKLGLDPGTVSSIFPMIDDLIELNGGFLHDMKRRQSDSPNFCINNIGDILVKFFGGEYGEMLKYIYGYFCSHHLEAVSLYKEFLKNDKKFAHEMKSCLLNKRARRLSVPECITYVTIRMTKYPLLIEAIIKATKESLPGYENLKESLHLVKDVLKAVDEAVNIYEQEKELVVLKKSLDRKNVVEIKSEKGNSKIVYKTTKLFHKRSRLLYDKKTNLRGKSKICETRMVILAEKIIFFQENSGKLQLLSIENKAPVLSLKNLMVREVATDKTALYLLSTSKDAAQIYEIVCDSYRDKKEFMPKLQVFIKNCPEEEEENLTDLEEEARKEEEERMIKLKEIISQLQSADEQISNTLAEKTRLVSEMREVIDAMDEGSQIKSPQCSELKPADIYNARGTLEACLKEVTTLSSTVCIQQVEAPAASPIPSPGASNNAINNVLPSKRSDTFAGFDQRMKPPYSLGNVNRAATTKPSSGRSSGSSETDSGPNKPRKQSQFLGVLGRTKTMGSTEDLTSLSSSTSTTSLSTTLSQMTLFQSLKDHLSSLVDVTSKQDLEMGRMRHELQEARGEINKLKNERKEVEDRTAIQQKDSDRQIRNEKEQCAKLSREFKRNNEKLHRQIDEKKAQYHQLLEAYSELQRQTGTTGKSGQRTNSEEVIFF